jgi:hypothetical protein
MKIFWIICFTLCFLKCQQGFPSEVKKYIEYNPPVVSLTLKANGSLFIGDIEVKERELISVFSHASDRKWFMIVYFEKGSSKIKLSNLVGKAVSNGCYQVVIFDVPEYMGQHMSENGKNIP